MMTTTVQYLLVTVVIVGSVAYAAWRLWATWQKGHDPCQGCNCCCDLKNAKKSACDKKK